MFGNLFKTTEVRNSKSTTSSTGYKGISLRKNGKFQATVTVYFKNSKDKVTGKTLHTSVHDTLKEAIKDREAFIIGLL